MDSLLYPTFNCVEGRGLIPNIYLPRDFEQRIPVFYKQGRKDEVEEYAGRIRDLYKPDNLARVLLRWDEEKGLVNISIGTSGLDLNDRGMPCFQEHNLGGHYSFIAGAIAMKYISELIKSNLV